MSPTTVLDPSRDRVDYPQLGVLLRTILRVRTRVRRSFGRRPRGLLFLIVLYAVMGLFSGMVAFLEVDLFTYALILCGMTMVMGGMTMVAESSQLLFSPDEHDILGHRPIGPRTLLLARSLSLLGLTLLMALSLNLLPMFFGLWIAGSPPWFPLAHLITIVMLSAFCAAAVVFVYVLLARLIGRERFDSFASWMQLAVSVTFILGYQIIPRLIERTHGLHVPPDRPWLLALPPAWFAALETVLAGAAQGPALARLAPMAAVGVGATLILGWAAVNHLAGDYARRLASLGEATVRATRAEPAADSSRPEPGSPARLRPGAAALTAALRSWMPDPIERAAFRLAAAYMRRDRDTRMRLYPSLAAYVVFPIIALIDPKKGVFMPVMTVVMASMLPASTMLTLKMSPHFAAADVFRYAPLRGTAAVFHGVRKAAIAFMLIPVLVVSVGILLAALRDFTWMIAVVPALLVMPTLTLIEGLTGDYLPLSLPPTTGRQSAINIGLYLLSTLIAGGLSVAGFFARRSGWFGLLLGVELVIVIGLHAALLRGIRVRRLTPLE
jgi:hypothetical protein